MAHSLPGALCRVDLDALRDAVKTNTNSGEVGGGGLLRRGGMGQALEGRLSWHSWQPQAWPLCAWLLALLSSPDDLRRLVQPAPSSDLTPLVFPSSAQLQDPTDIFGPIPDVQQHVADSHLARAAAAAGGAGGDPPGGGDAAGSDRDEGSHGMEQEMEVTVGSLGFPGYTMLQRVPAELTWRDRDCFSVAVLDGLGAAGAGPVEGGPRDRSPRGRDIKVEALDPDSATNSGSQVVAVQIEPGRVRQQQQV